jgi:hypothetical protein
MLALVPGVQAVMLSAVRLMQGLFRRSSQMLVNSLK